MINGESKRKVIICVDAFADGVVEGRFFYDDHRTATPFHGLMQLLLDMNVCFDNARFPQAFETMRTFDTEEKEMPKLAFDHRREEQYAALPQIEGTKEEGKLATFRIRIMFRQNNSWQGTVTWMETNARENFRSVMELINLMNSALRNTEAKAEN